MENQIPYDHPNVQSIILLHTIKLIQRGTYKYLSAKQIIKQLKTVSINPKIVSIINFDYESIALHFFHRLIYCRSIQLIQNFMFVLWVPLFKRCHQGV